MSPVCRLLKSSLGKKYLMALSGIVLTGFVLGHMGGNLQFFLHPDWINQYAYKLHTLPYGLLWVARIVLLVSVVVHIWTAIVLTIENRKARPADYEAKATIQASYASRTMRYSGFIILAFILFHIAHFTTQNVPGLDYESLKASYFLPGVDHPVMNVYAMMYLGFRPIAVVLFYALATYLLCMHLSHGVSSMFQSLGIRNQFWRPKLDTIAKVYGWVVFLGFVSIPVAVQLDNAGIVQIFDTSSFETVLAAAKEQCCPISGLPLE